MQVISVGTLTKILVNNLPHPPSPPPPPQAMLSFDDHMHIYARKTIYLHLSILYWGRGDNAQIVPLKITLVVLNDSLVIFWTVFTTVPTTFDLHCLKVTMQKKYVCGLFLHEKGGSCGHYSLLKDDIFLNNRQGISIAPHG